MFSPHQRSAPWLDENRVEDALVCLRWHSSVYAFVQHNILSRALNYVAAGTHVATINRLFCTFHVLPNDWYLIFNDCNSTKLHLILNMVAKTTSKEYFNGFENNWALFEQFHDTVYVWCATKPISFMFIFCHQIEYYIRVCSISSVILGFEVFRLFYLVVDYELNFKRCKILRIVIWKSRWGRFFFVSRWQHTVMSCIVSLWLFGCFF